ncbi:CRISPR-associated endoribonuclease Cas6 [bacterium]|nr:CRISPR-associated endoribonuclease Cas6 [bacterium]
MIVRLYIEILKGNILGYNYQYPLSGFIYKTIAKADAQFATFLHNEGYRLNEKQFKHFTFSSLNFGKGGMKHIPKSDRFYINSRTMLLELRFFIPKAAETFIIGLFNQQEFGLGDKLNRIDCHVGRVETLAVPDFSKQEALFKTNSPILLSEPQANGHAHYLNPEKDAQYAAKFLENLRNKWQSLSGNVPDGEMEFSLLEGSVKRQGIKIKAFTKAETQIIPYHFKFKLCAPEAILRLGYLSGFGVEGSMGLGCCEVIENK